MISTGLLFVVTAIAEIIGCYLPWLWLRQGGSIWLLLPAALSLAIFSWLLTLHPDATGRVYAIYGGIYISTAIVWLWLVDGIKPTAWDISGVGIILIGASIIIYGSRFSTP
ncbi:YnfA family protein [Poseidonibacter lekithochrous]|uniref:YnfA family protein n=1 Tax=Poseidonibacter TaxID=2321187 RepID=UPI001C086493|nr:MULTISPECIES: YnfA family protein [Poseidonibacter]MBU3014707.1 YnfA family protein [Poseidonibacter lekithochrous]MDO6828005.1 YnfA family protein [Poseidonibacter sp. 1_MG-2023]